MTADKKSPSTLDKIDDIETQVKATSSDDEEKVISIHIPRRTSSGSTTTHVKSDETVMKPKADLDDDKDVESKADLSSKSESETSPKEAVSSFSLLDADKKSESPTVEKQPTETNAPLAEVASPNEPEKEKESSEENLNKWLEQAEPSTMTDMPSTIEPEKRGGKLKAFIIALLIVMLLGAIGGGIYYYTTRVSNNEPTTETPTTDLPTPTSTPVPTEAPEAVELSEYSVEVLNGSGVAGQAGVVASLLADEGFGTADAANADNQSYEETIVTMKAETPDGVFSELERILGDDYVLERASETLEEDSEYDVQVILGSTEPEETTDESAEEATPTPTEEAGI